MNQPFLEVEAEKYNYDLPPKPKLCHQPSRERVIKKHIKNFYKNNVSHKFRNFFDWMDSPKEEKLDLQIVYQKIKNHYFSYNGPDGFHVLKENFPIYDFVISGDNSTFFLAVGKEIIIRTETYHISTLRGHRKDISALVLKANNLFSGGLDNDLIMWDWEEIKIVHIFKIHEQPILSIAVSQDRLFSAGEDKFIIIHSLIDFSVISTLKGHYSSINSIVLDPSEKILYSAGNDKNIIVWDLHLGINQKMLKGHTDIVDALALNPNFSILASGSHDKTVKIWNLENYEILFSFKGHEGYITKVIWSIDGKNIISASSDTTLRIWNLELKIQLKSLESHTQLVTCLKTFEDGKSLISSSLDGSLKKWKILENIEQKMKLKVEKKNKYLKQIYEDDSNCIVINKKGTKIFSANTSNKINVWSVKLNKIIKFLEDHNNQVSSLILNSDENLLISGSHDQTIKIWDWKAGKLLKTIKKFNHFISCLALSADGKFFAAGSLDKTANVYDFANLDVEKYCLKKSSGKIYSVVFTPNGDQIITGNDNHEIMIYNLEEGIGNSILCKVFKSAGRIVSSLVIAIESGNLISASNEGKIEVWNLSDFQFKCILDEKAIVLSLASSGNELISGGPEGAVHIWNLETYKQILIIQEHTEKIKSITIPHDLSKIYCASKNKTFFSLEWSAKKRLPFFEGHSSDVLALALSQDQEYSLIATGGQDCLICLWDLQTLKLYKILRGCTNPIYSLRFTNDRSKLVSATSGTDITMWDIDKGKPIRTWEVESPPTYFIINNHMDRLIVGSIDCVIRVIDMKAKKETHQEIQKLEGHQRPYIVLDQFEDDGTLYSGAKDGLIIKWDLSKWRKTKECKAHVKSVTVLKISKKHNSIFSGSLDGTIKLWNPEDLTLITTFNFPNTKILSISLDLNENELLVNGEDRLFTLDLQSNNKFELPFKPKGIIQAAKHPLTEHENYIAILKCHDSLGVGVLYQINRQSGKKVKTIHGNSNKVTTLILSNDSSKMIFSDENNRIIYWDLLTNSQLFVHKGHTARINHIFETPDSKLISCSSDKTLRIWKKEQDSKPMILYGHLNSVTFFVFHNEHIFSVSLDKTLRIWNKNSPVEEKIIQLNCPLYAVDVRHSTEEIFVGGSDKYIRILDKNLLEIRLFALSGSPIQKLQISSDGQILLTSHENKNMKVWDIETKSLINILSMQSTGDSRLSPKFLTNNHRYIIYANKIYDILDDKNVFSFLTSAEINMCYFDHKKYEFFYLNHKFEFWKLESFWLQNYFYHNIKSDSLGAISRKEDFLCSLRSSHYPFNISFSHIAAIFRRLDCFTLQKFEEIYKGSLNLSKFYLLDIFKNTALDILLLHGDVSLNSEKMVFIKKYFDLVFLHFDDPRTKFYQKVRFLNYEFRPEYNILNIIIEIFSLCNGDLSILFNLFNKSFLEIDPTIYNDTLRYELLESYVLIETDSIFTCDHDFIEKNLLAKLNVKKYEENYIDHRSIIKCKVICLPNIVNLKDKNCRLVLQNLMNLEQDSPMLQNPVFKIILHYIWVVEMQFYYKIDLFVFLFFFLLFNFNYSYLLQRRIDPENIMNPPQSLHYSSMVMDVLLMFYSLYSFCNEAMQLKLLGISDYFKSIWNYFDIALIPLMMASSLLDISITYLISDSQDPKLFWFKLIFAVSMLLLWFRLISFSRAFKETSYMIRLIFNVLISVRYFVLFTILFILTLASTYFVLHNNSPTSDNGEIVYFTFWQSFYDFYQAVLGDTSGIIDNEIIDSHFLTTIFDIGTCFIFSIILMNLLLAIVWDKYYDIQQREELTRNFELMNIMSDLNTSLTHRIVKFIRNYIYPHKKYPKYLLYLYSEEEKNSKVKINDFESLGNALGAKIEEKEEKLLRKIEKIHLENKSLAERLGEVEQIIKENNEETNKKINDFLKTSGKNMENLFNEYLEKFGKK